MTAAPRSISDVSAPASVGDLGIQPETPAKSPGSDLRSATSAPVRGNRSSDASSVSSIQTLTNARASSNGRGRSHIASTTLRIAVTVPTPTATATRAAVVSAGARA